MTSENLEKEFEIRRLKNANKQLMNTNTMLNRQYKNLNEHFKRRVNEEEEQKLKIIKPTNKIVEVKVKTNGKTVPSTAQDTVGNTITAKTTINNIDKELPTLT